MAILELKKLFDILNTVKKEKGESIKDVSTSFRNGSITKKAKDSIFQFPVLISDNISKENYTAIMRTLETTYANYIKIIVSNNEDLVNLNSNQTKAKFLKKIHTNDPLGDKFTQNLKESNTLFISVNESEMRQICHELKHANIDLLTPYLENYNFNNINDFTIISEGVSEDARKQEEQNKKQQKKIEDQEKEIEKLKQKRTSSVDIKNSNEIKKNNELEPTVLTLSINYQSESGIQETNIIIGIKTIGHIVKSAEIAKTIPDSIRDNKVLFKFLQWTSGEIKFWKDFVFNLDKLKFEATSKQKSVRLLRHLKNRSSGSKLKTMMSGSSPFIPNATFVLSIDEVDEIKSQGIDLLDRNKTDVIKLMDIYFLLGVLIVDEPSQLVYIFDDNTVSWNEYSISSLKSQSSKSDSFDLKTIITAMK